MEKQETFKSELNLIKNENIKNFVKEFLNTVPDYFFTIAASSTGKYHPGYALGVGGLVRHTKAATRIANELFRLNMFLYNDIEKDLIIASLILHDTYKHGKNNSAYTMAEHPIIASQEILNSPLEIEQEYREIIANNISTHMGQWNTDYKTQKEILPLPKTKMQNFVHICDYLASRKCLEFNFNCEL